MALEITRDLDHKITIFSDSQGALKAIKILGGHRDSTSIFVECWDIGYVLNVELGTT
ncbi:MAG: hypothetical protein M1840_006946 [Geoglossum simile]|nr:MAG: hypothetical protein M1840_006946 [Geoglossum simile]